MKVWRQGHLGFAGSPATAHASSVGPAFLLPDAQHCWFLLLSSCPLSDVGGRRRLVTRVGQRNLDKHMFNFPAQAVQLVLVVWYWESAEVRFKQHIWEERSVRIIQKDIGPVLAGVVPSHLDSVLSTLQERGWGYCRETSGRGPVQKARRMPRSEQDQEVRRHPRILNGNFRGSGRRAAPP